MKYRVERDFWDQGFLKRAGETVEMTERQAYYHVLSGALKPVLAPAESTESATTAEAAAPRRRRS